MVDTHRRPLLNPVLRFTKDPKPEGVSGGGKNAGSIMTDRLPEQRRALSRQFRELAAQAAQRPRFDGRVVLYASMFDDSLAPSYTPHDLFQATRSARLIAPYRSGYLVEIAADQLGRYAGIVETSGLAKDRVDISRIEAVRFFESADAGGAAKLQTRVTSDADAASARVPSEAVRAHSASDVSARDGPGPSFGVSSRSARIPAAAMVQPISALRVSPRPVASVTSPAPCPSAPQSPRRSDACTAA